MKAWPPTTAVTFDAEQLHAIWTELINRVDAIECDQGIDDDNREEVEMLRALVRRLEAAKRRIENAKKRRRV